MTWTRSCGWLVVGLLLASCRTQADVERDYAHTLRPAELAAPLPDRGPVVSLRLRVLVDDDYQSHVIGWRDKVRDQIERVNGVLAVAYHVRFEPELRSWHRKTNDPRLEVALAELEATDPGTDCDWVLGLTGVLPVATTDLHHIGMARILSKHMVAHAMDDPSEAQAFARAFPSLSEDERFALYRDRKRHKEVTVLLHEWAHTLGAVHSRISSDLMHPAYDNTQSAFGAPNAQIVEDNLAARRRGEAPDSVAARDVVSKALALNGCPACDPDELTGRTAQTPAASTPAPAPASPVSATADAAASPDSDPQLREAIAAFQAHDVTKAWALAAPYSEAHPAILDAQKVACLAAMVQAHRVDGRAACARWVALAKEDPDAEIGSAWTAEGAGDTASASTHLARAQTLLAGATEPSREAWANVARLAQNLTMVSIVDGAAGHLADAKEQSAMRSWSRTTRRRLGLAAGKHDVVPVAEEAEYAVVIQKATDHLAKSDLARTEALVREALARWPNAPGLLALRCELREDRRQHEKALADCDAAIRGDDEAVWAHFDRALIALDARDLDRAVVELERVRALDPTIKNAWRNLIQLRTSQGNAVAAQRLREEFEKQFGAAP